MPTADTSVSRSHRDSSLTYPRKSGFDSIYTFDTSSKVHLRSSPSYTPDRFSRPFPTSLTTIALYNSRTGRFDSSIGWPKPRDLLSSLIQHGKLRFPSGHTRVGNGLLLTTKILKSETIQVHYRVMKLIVGKQKDVFPSYLAIHYFASIRWIKLRSLTLHRLQTSFTFFKLFF